MQIGAVGCSIATSFCRSLINQDCEALADPYANEYVLVRPDGSVLNKEAVLHDLKLGGLTERATGSDCSGPISAT